MIAVYARSMWPVLTREEYPASKLLSTERQNVSSTYDAVTLGRILQQCTITTAPRSGLDGDELETSLI